MKLTTVLKYLWASPNTLLVLPFLPFSKWQVVDGVIELHGPAVRFVLNHFPLCKGAAAMTVGHAVIGQNKKSLDWAHKHEMIHVRQYETFGPFFIPLYFMLSLHAWRTGECPYYGNLFEQEAYAKDGR